MKLLRTEQGVKKGKFHSKKVGYSRIALISDSDVELRITVTDGFEVGEQGYPTISFGFQSHGFIFTPDCFKDIETDAWKNQYSFPDDCPLARAFKAAGYYPQGISAGWVNIEGKGYYHKLNYMGGVREIRYRLLTGEPFVELTFEEI